jgi:14-3-3 protein epsilon
MDEKRSQLISRAKLAEHAERYDDMVGHMKKLVAGQEGPLSIEERHLFSVAFKNVMGSHRGAWRTIYKLELQTLDILNAAPEVPQHERDFVNTQQYRRALESQAVSIIRLVLELLQSHVIPNTSAPISAAIPLIGSKAEEHRQSALTSCQTFEDDLLAALAELEASNHCLSEMEEGESLVFFFKMMGDYRRFWADFFVDAEHELDRTSQSLHALGAYLLATEIGKTQLPPSHPVRLGLALNFSIFYHDLVSQPARAAQLARNAFDEAVAELDQLTVSERKDSTFIMRALRQNLTLWAGE